MVLCREFIVKKMSIKSIASIKSAVRLIQVLNMFSRKGEKKVRHKGEEEVEEKKFKSTNNMYIVY